MKAVIWSIVTGAVFGMCYVGLVVLGRKPSLDGIGEDDLYGDVTHSADDNRIVDHMTQERTKSMW